jgi:hypothetical protein
MTSWSVVYDQNSHIGLQCDSSARDPVLYFDCCIDLKLQAQTDKATCQSAAPGY